MGSVVILTDRNGQIEERYQYDVWGKAYDGKFADEFPGYGHNDNVYGFTGQRYQAELGVYSFPYRDYSPRTMRWLTEDPVKDGINWYNYCGNDPVNFIDPLGLCQENDGRPFLVYDEEEGIAIDPATGVVYDYRNGLVSVEPKSVVDSLNDEWVNPMDDLTIRGQDDKGAGWYGASRDGGTRTHEGVDYLAPTGTPVVAEHEGTVRVSNTERGGNMVSIDFTNQQGDAMTINNAHLDTVTVENGQHVNAGDQIGTVGTTGNAEGTRSHLHMGVYVNGESVDPGTYFPGSTYPEGLKNSGAPDYTVSQ